MLGLVISSHWRRPLRLGYEAWRVSHALVRIAALALARLHVSLNGVYTRQLLEPLLGVSGTASRVFLCGPNPKTMVMERILLDCGIAHRRSRWSPFDSCGRFFGVTGRVRMIEDVAS
jgi:hypothetical protein